MRGMWKRDRLDHSDVSREELGEQIVEECVAAAEEGLENREKQDDGAEGQKENWGTWKGGSVWDVRRMEPRITRVEITANLGLLV